MLLQDQADALSSVEQRPLTVVASVCLPTKDGAGQVLALESTEIVCHAFSACGTRFVAADNHGILHFGHVPSRPLVSRQATFDFEIDDNQGGFPHSFARAVSRMMEDVYGGPSVMSHMLHYRGYREWACLALADRLRTRFAAMDRDGVVEVWSVEGCTWFQERVTQRRCVPAYRDGKSSLEWNPEGSELSMTDNYGQAYRFIRTGWFGRRWKQLRIEDAS